jgi:hypothetical protein
VHSRQLLWIAGVVSAFSLALAAWWLMSRTPQGEPRPQVREVAPPRLPVEQKATQAPDAGVDSCHDEELTAKDVRIQRVNGTPQQASGGKLLDGVYDVATYEVFGKTPERALPSTFRQTMVVEQNGMVTKTIRIGRRGEVETTTWSSRARGSDLELTGMCPPAVNGAEETVSFAVQGEDLLLFFEQAGVPVQITYRRRSS